MYRKIEGVVVAMVTPLQRKSAMINVEETKRLIGFLLDKGIDGIFILGTTGEGLLLPVTDCSFFLYDIPQLAGNRITPSIVENLTRSHQNLVGIKTSNPNLLDFQKFLLLKNKLTILIGCDSLVYPALLLGAQGVVSGPSSIFPEIYVLLYRAFKDNNYKIFRECQLIINEIVDLLQGGENLIFFERTLQARGFDIEMMRPSLFDSSIPEKMRYSALVRDFLKNRYSKVLENLSSMA